MKSHFLLATFAVLSTAAMSSLSPSAAVAVVVTVNNQHYDLFTIVSAYDGAIADFDAPLLGGKMPWWGDPNSAAQFAEEVYDSLAISSEPGYGPIFAYAYDPSLAQVLGSVADLSMVGSSEYRTYARTAAANYVFAASPVPGPLPFFGAAAAFGWTHRLRRRIGNH
jgi:hypothetical protein